MNTRFVLSACAPILATLLGTFAEAAAPKVFPSSLVVNLQGAKGITQRNSPVREISLQRKGSEWALWLYGADIKLDASGGVAAKTISPVCIVSGNREEVMALYKRLDEVVRNLGTQVVCAGTLNKWGQNVVSGADGSFSIVLRP